MNIRVHYSRLCFYRFMYGNEALSVNQWYGVEFNNTNCQYVDFNLTEALPPPLRPDIPHPIYNTISRIIDAFQSSLICYGEDILDQFNFSSVILYFKILKIYIPDYLQIEIYRISSFVILSAWEG